MSGLMSSGPDAREVLQRETRRRGAGKGTRTFQARLSGKARRPEKRVVGRAASHSNAMGGSKKTKEEKKPGAVGLQILSNQEAKDDWLRPHSP